MEQTTQQNLEIRFRKQLKTCGFQSWKKANARRGELIDVSIDTGESPEELPQLQLLCEMYVEWKTHKLEKRMLRELEKLESNLKRHNAFNRENSETPNCP